MDAETQHIKNLQPIPLVSIIMSVYNGEQFLQKAIDSILNQTYNNLQFIIIDDCSNNATKEILFAIKDKRVEVIYNIQQHGLTKNLNTAINYCKGKYIARMDADDISLPARIEKQVNFLEYYNHLAGCATFINLINEKEEITGIWQDDRKYVTEQQIKKILPTKNVIAHPTVMLRANILKKYKYNSQQKHSQDWDLWLRLFADDLVISKIEEPLLQYRIHTSSVTSAQKNKSVFKKQHETYKNYLANVTAWNNFNNEIKKAYQKNKLKMVGSSIKRFFIK